MSINGINGAVGHPAIRPGHVGDSETGKGARAIRTPTSTPPATASAGAQGALSAEAPAGTDPALWSVLTAEERSFFAKADSIGLLTYSPRRSANAGAATIRGGRIDVKV